MKLTRQDARRSWNHLRMVIARANPKMPIGEVLIRNGAVDLAAFFLAQWILMSRLPPAKAHKLLDEALALAAETMAGPDPKLAAETIANVLRKITRKRKR